MEVYSKEPKKEPQEEPKKEPQEEPSKEPGKKIIPYGITQDGTVDRILAPPPLSTWHEIKWMDQESQRWPVKEYREAKKIRADLFLALAAAVVGIAITGLTLGQSWLTITSEPGSGRNATETDDAPTPAEATGSWVGATAGIAMLIASLLVLIGSAYDGTYLFSETARDKNIAVIKRKLAGTRRLEIATKQALKDKKIDKAMAKKNQEKIQEARGKLKALLETWKGRDPLDEEEEREFAILMDKWGYEVPKIKEKVEGVTVDISSGESSDSAEDI